MSNNRLMCSLLCVVLVYVSRHEVHGAVVPSDSDDIVPAGGPAADRKPAEPAADLQPAGPAADVKDIEPAVADVIDAGPVADVVGAVSSDNITSDALPRRLVHPREACFVYCERGTMVPDPDHKPAFNGCGSYGINVDLASCPYLTDCCNIHDICYDTCLKTRVDCDDRFYRCTQDGVSALMDTEQQLHCRAAGAIMSAAVDLFGCSAYKSAQINACICV